MKIENYKKTKEELRNQKVENNNKIILSDERCKLLKETSFENKALTTLTFAMLGYLPLFMISSNLINNFGVSIFTNIIPAYSFPAFMLGSSIGIGALGRALLYKIRKIKEKFRSFSKSKKESERLKEEINYKIEIEKAKNRNLAIDETIKNLDIGEILSEKISDKYNVSGNNSIINYIILEKKELSKFIKGQYDKLDLISTKKVLYDYFGTVILSSKWEKFVEAMKICFISGVFTLFSSALSISLVKDALTYSSPYAPLAIAITPLLVGMAGAGAYIAKINKEQKKVFDSFNIKLGENTSEEFDKLLGMQINNISLGMVELEKINQILHLLEEKKSEDERDLSITNSLNCKNVETPLPDIADNISPDLFVSNQEEQAPKLVKKRKINNPNNNN